MRFKDEKEIAGEIFELLKRIETLLDFSEERGSDVYRLKESNRESILEALELIEGLDSKEIEELKQNGQIEYTEKFESFRSEIGKIKSFIKKNQMSGEEAEKVYAELEKLEQFIRQFYSDIPSESLDDLNLKQEPIGSGKDKVVYETVDGNHVLLVYRNEPEKPKIKTHFHKNRKVIEEKNVEMPRMEKMGSYKEDFCILMEKASGIEIHKAERSIGTIDNANYERWSEINEKIANCDLKVYKKFLRDVKVLRKYNFIIDYAKPENFFYSERKQSFIIIDEVLGLGVENKSLNRSNLIYPFTGLELTKFFEQEVDEDDLENLKKIYSKFRKSGLPESSTWKSRFEELKNRVRKSGSA